MPAAHRPTEITRRVVTELSLVACPQSRIAERINVSEPTLRKHYATEIAEAIDDMAYEALCDLRKQSRNGRTQATIHLLRRYETNSWRENPKIEHGGRIDGDGSRVVVTVPDNGRLAVEQTNGKTADAPPG